MRRNDKPGLSGSTGEMEAFHIADFVFMAKAVLGKHVYTV